ncbi:MAG TPA: hypothetical protein VFO89_10845, partial [Thermoanaerobaculia bacterium]|nr:hypothetical protein [Thermoanaerobaculia bacterium]
MNGARRRIGLGITALAAGLALSGATLQLNPTVNRVESAHAALPPECDESLAPAATPRIDVARISAVEPPLDPQAPPPADLRPTLVRLQNALERNDRAAFDDALADAKAIVADHPSGGGR